LSNACPIRFTLDTQRTGKIGFRERDTAFVALRLPDVQ
jgi:hypothetical protein